MNRRIRTLATATCLFLVVFGASAAIAQESRGSIAGLVTDSSGGALPGVTVNIVNNGTNAMSSQVTNESGQYTALFLQPGTYTVSVELSGFQKKEHQNIQVHVAERVVARRDAVPRRCIRVRPRRRREPAARERPRDDRPGDRQQADQRDPAGGWNRLRIDAPDSRCVVRTVVCAAAADGQRQPPRHDDHGDDQQRVHHRRIEQRRVGSTRRHSAAVGRHRGIQGRDRGLRRADRPHGGRSRQPRAEERHEPVSRRRVVLQPRRFALREPLGIQSKRIRKISARLQPLQRHHRRADFQEQDVLHVLLREAAGRHG